MNYITILILPATLSIAWMQIYNKKEINMVKKTVIFLFIVLLQLNMPNLYANDNIQIFNSNMTVRTFAETSQLNLEFYYYDDSQEYFSKSICYSPSVGINTGIGFSYKDLGFSYSTKVTKTGFNLQDFKRNNYGKTKQTDHQIYYYTRKHGIELIYQQYKGFYLDNYKSYGYSENDPEFKRSDFKMTNIGINYIYAFSDDFSLKASFNQTERQVTWDYSFLIMISQVYFNMKSNYSLIPEDQEQYYGKYAGFRGGKFYGIAVSPGIAITIPLYNFYITSAFFCNFWASYMIKKYQTSSGEINERGTFFHAKIKAAIGYNGDNYFCGASFYTGGPGIDSFSGSGMSADVYVDYLEIFAGIRI